jgi:hypothetical protein
VLDRLFSFQPVAIHHTIADVVVGSNLGSDLHFYSGTEPLHSYHDLKIDVFLVFY